MDDSQGTAIGRLPHICKKCRSLKGRRHLFQINGMIGKFAVHKVVDSDLISHIMIFNSLTKTLTLWSIILCSGAVARFAIADEPIVAPRQRHACDLILEKGVLSVQLVNSKGAGVSDVTSILRFRGRPVTILATDSKGRVAFRHITTGLYELNIGSRTEFIRVWEKETAPRAAWETLILVQDGNPIGITGPFSVIELMGPGGAPAPLVPGQEKLAEACRAADIRIPVPK